MNSKLRQKNNIIIQKHTTTLNLLKFNAHRLKFEVYNTAVSILALKFRKLQSFKSDESQYGWIGNVCVCVRVDC